MQKYPVFFTATINWWKHLLEEDKYKNIIIDSLRFLVENRRVKVYAFVLMPNHLHLIWEVLDGQKLPEVQRDFLKFTSQQIKFDLQKNSPNKLREFEVNLKDRKHRFWKDRSLSIAMYNDKIFMQKLNYIHNYLLQEH